MPSSHPKHHRTPAEAPTLTVAILTLDEGRRIARCIGSAAFATQIVVVDGGSSDDTVEQARALGAEVFVYGDWQGFAEQRNRLLAHARGDYVFFLDADEVVPPELAAEIGRAVASGERAVWEVQWSQVAYGRPLTRMVATGGIRRLFRRADIVRFEGVVHESAVLAAPAPPVRRFRHRLLHYSRESVHGSLLKLTQYVQLGAAKRHAAGKRGGVARGLASALASFARLYVLRRGFLCGPEGFLFCLFIALECFFRYAALEYDYRGRKEAVAPSRRS